MSATAVTPGRRERKKRATRDALRAAARRLFAERGYAETTVRDIADAADVSERTFFRYFASKEEVLLPDLADLLASAERGIAARLTSEPPLRAIREAAVEVVAASEALPALASGVDSADPVVLGRLVNAFVAWQDRLAALLVERAAAPEGVDVELQAAVVAHAAVAAVRAALRTLRLRRGRYASGDVTAAFTATLRDAFAVLEAGCPPPGGGGTPTPTPATPSRS